MKMYFWMARSRGAQKQSRLGLLTGSGSALACSDGQKGNPEKAERHRSGHGKSDPLETRRWAAKEIVPRGHLGTGHRKSLRPGGFEPPTDGLEISRNMQDSTGKTGISQVIGPPTGPRSSNGQKTSSVEGQFLAADDDQDLSRVINAWHSLAEPIRRAILALIGAASN